MTKLIKGTALAVGILATFLACLWWWIGHDWRALVSDPPAHADILFWSQQQRESGFRLMDQMPLVVESRKINAGPEENTYPLPTGTPIDLGIDVEAFAERQQLAGAVIVHRGQVRLEYYGLGFEADERWTSFSVGKSLTSSLVGIAIKEGHISSIDDKVSDYVEGLKGSPYDDVTIEQLLTMTSGVDWNETYTDPKSDVALFNSTEPEEGMSVIVTYMRQLGRAHPPGEVWNYSTGETNLIGILVGEATGRDLSDYLSEKIWQPFGMEADATWLLGSDDNEISGCCIQARVRDFARFGQFILNGGEIEGASILPAGWVETATTKQADIGVRNRGYGYQWWTYDDGAFAADGIFGQGIFVDPNRDLVIATNSNWTTALGNSGGENRERSRFYKTVQAAIDRESAE